MSEITGQRRRQVLLTAFALFGLAALMLGLFVRQFIDVDRLDPKWLQMRGTLLFEEPRELPLQGLVDHRGSPFDGSDFLGHWSLLFFGYTYCPDICPTTMATLQQTVAALRERGAKQLPRVFLVSVDPARDTPEVLARYVEFFGSEFAGITGDFLDIHHLATAANVPFRKVPGEGENYLVDHGIQLVLVGPEGQYRGFMRPPFEVRRLADTLGAILRTYGPR